MSTKIMASLWPIKMSPTKKSVAISLADNANDEGFCWPSIKKISERTCLSERAVQKAIKSLIDDGVLVLTERSGRSNVFQINEPRSPRTTCTPPPHHVHPTPAPRAPRTVKEPSKEPSLNNTVAKATFDLPEWVPVSVWNSWIEYRKSRRLSVSAAAMNGHISLLNKFRNQGMDICAVIQQSIEQGWQGLFALKNQQQGFVSRRDQERANVINNLTYAGIKKGGDDNAVIDITPKR